jgi:tetratricopeptide (TPR) repeat protein
MSRPHAIPAASGRRPVSPGLAAVVALSMGLVVAGCVGSPTSPVQLSETEGEALAASNTNIASLTDVIRRNPNDPQAYNLRGSVYGRDGRQQEALADFNRALQLDPNYVQALANRGLLYRRSNRLDLALADYDRALSIDPSYAPAFVGRGVVRRLQGQPQAAIEDLNRAIQLQPNNPQAFHHRGLLQQSLAQHPAAIEDFNTAVTQAPTTAIESVVARGLSHLAMGNIPGALHDFDQAVAADPRNKEAWTARGLAHERNGDRERAAGNYAKAMNIDDQFEPARAGFTRVGGRFGQTYNVN